MSEEEIGHAIVSWGFLGKEILSMCASNSDVILWPSDLSRRRIS